MKPQLLATAARRTLWAAAVPFSLTVGSVVQAQDTDMSAVGEEVSESSADDGVIIVTAQRRAQNLQDVPAAVTALTGADLQNRQIADTNDLQNQIPNVVISTGTGTSSSARIYFRGIGEDESRGAIDPAVGIYIDNVYLGRTVGSLVDLVDIEQVEVLRGPQGTLYGRNTNGGAIKITSVRPQIGETSFSGEVGYGNHERIMGRGTVNAGVGDNMAFRFSGLYKEREGFWDLNPTGDLAGEAQEDIGKEQVFALRGSWFGELSDRWEFLLNVDYTDDKSDPVPSSIIPDSDDPTVVTDRDGDVFTIEPAAGVNCVGAVPQIFQQIGCYLNYGAQVQSFGVSHQFKGTYDTFEISSTTAYRTLNDELFSHISFPYSQETDQSQFSQELLFSSDFEGPFNFVAGAFYFDEDLHLDSVFFFPFSVDVQTESIALFGQANVKVGDLTLTGGARWTDETRDYNGSGPGGTRIESLDTSNVTWTAKVDYSFTEDILVYGSYSTGFKSPGFSPDCFSPAACFLPVTEEELDSIEVGLRTQFADGAVTFNATYFYNDYKDLQISGTLPTGGFTRVNAGEAQIQGVELEASFRPTPGLNIYANASWLDAEYDSLNFTQAAVLTGSSTTNPGATCSNATADPVANAATYQSQIVDCGLALDLKNAPEWKATIGFNYEFDLGSGEGFIGSDVAYEDDSFGLVANNPGSLIEPGVRIDARAGYRAPDGRWTITLWGKNLTDREYWRATTGANMVYAAPPLTFGVDVGFRFD